MPAKTLKGLDALTYRPRPNEAFLWKEIVHVCVFLIENLSCLEKVTESPHLTVISEV
jgi:hypothetical protein